MIVGMPIAQTHISFTSCSEHSDQYCSIRNEADYIRTLGGPMAYEEREAKRSRVVVETPTARREYVQSESTAAPERGGISGATVGVIVVLAVAVVTILVLLLLSGQNSEESQLAAQQPAPVPQTTIIQQPAPQQQPPVIVTQPATQPAPVIVTQPSSGGSTTTNNDSAIQAEVDKRLLDEPALKDVTITATLDNGKVMLIGTVKSEAVKATAERVAKSVKGVTSVDNQIAVIP
jgi:hypothetical protein